MSQIKSSSLSPVVLEIAGNWEFAQRLPVGRDVFQLAGGAKNWLPAVVPGNVHVDLARAGVIQDPFYRLGEIGAQWVDDADWTYQTIFEVTADQWSARGTEGRHFLQFGGLDTCARIYLNNNLIAETENGFVPFRFDVTDSLVEGPNSLRVELDSAMRIGRERASNYLGNGTSERGQQTYFNFGPRAFIRKPQYQWGWDWGPELVGVGITGAVELITVPHAEIVDWKLDYHFTDAITVEMTVSLTIAKYSHEPLTAGIALYAPGDNTPEEELPDEPGTYTISLPVYDQKVAPWNPNGQDVLQTLSLPYKPKGDAQKRYLLNLRVWRSDTDSDGERDFVFHKGVTVGFKKIELIQEPDADGKGVGFKFRVNGSDTYIKGANWIPDSPYPGCITRDQLRHKLTMARDSGCNMLRVWGGGLYESEEFYNLCDELGLLVWQDFGFGCSMYPDDLPEFVESVRTEAQVAIRRLRHRVSLALWCGGNENMELGEERWSGELQATRFFGDKLIHETLPQLLGELDPSTIYWPNSPYSGVDGVTANSDDYGDAHYWKVWHGLGDWIHYTANNCRFSSEFGFASPCGFAAWEACTASEDRTPRSLVARWHDKTRKGYETYLGYIEIHFPEIKTWDDLVYFGQANQAMALSYGIEHWRRLKGRCWGTMFWQLNDCWPTQSWAVIDSSGEGKLAYYAAKRTFYKPILASLLLSEDTVQAHIVNDTLLPISGTLTLELKSMLSINSVDLPSAKQKVLVTPNSATGSILNLQIPDTIDRTTTVALVSFVGDDNTVIAENRLLLDEPKNLALPDPELDWQIEAGDRQTFVLQIGAKQFAGFVHLRIRDIATVNDFVPQFSDNGFHLLPGETRTIQITGVARGVTIEQVRASVAIRHLGMAM